MRIALILAICLLLTACPGMTKPDLPQGAITPTVVFVDRHIYVTIPPALTAEQPIASGPLSQCPDVASNRKAALRKVNAQLREIRAIQGTAVKP